VFHLLLLVNQVIEWHLDDSVEVTLNLWQGENAIAIEVHAAEDLLALRVIDVQLHLREHVHQLLARDAAVSIDVDLLLEQVP